MPPRARIASETFSAAPGNVIDTADILAWLEINGFIRTGTVRETGEYAVRGGIIDLFPAGLPNPVRLDFFGDALESIRTFDPESQRTIGTLRALDLVPMSEVRLTTETIKRFRQSYVATFGAPTRDDRLYEAVSEGRRYPGLEHWLPLFSERLDTLLAYLPDVPLVFDALADDAAAERLAQVKDYYDARHAAMGQSQPGVAPYRPLPPDALYLSPQEWADRLAALPVARLTPFAVPEQPGRTVIDCGARRGRSFIAERADENANVFEAAVRHIRTLQAQGRRVVLGAWSEGSRERLCHVLDDHGLTQTKAVARLADALALPREEVPAAVWGFEAGFEAGDLAVIGEQDILGDRLVRPRRSAPAAGFFDRDLGADAGRSRRPCRPRHRPLRGAEDDRGRGRAARLPRTALCGRRQAVPAGREHRAPDRYGSEDTEVQLDRLGGGAWQARKARLKKRIREMAGAADEDRRRTRAQGRAALVPPERPLRRVLGTFPIRGDGRSAERDRRGVDDLGTGRPMDRLSAATSGSARPRSAARAFVTAMNGKQVAVMVPTTLLARQHFRTFSNASGALRSTMAQASPLCAERGDEEGQGGLRDGTVDIVVGHARHARQGDRLQGPGLIVVYEEQHFGVAHKEALKELRAEVHVLMLSATLIPRTPESRPHRRARALADHDAAGSIGWRY